MLVELSAIFSRIVGPLTAEFTGGIAGIGIFLPCLVLEEDDLADFDDFEDLVEDFEELSLSDIPIIVL